MSTELVEISSEIREKAEELVREQTPGARSDIHAEDFIFQFVVTHPGMTTIHEKVTYYFTDGQRSAHQLAKLCEELGYGARKKISVLGRNFSYGARKKLRLLEFASGYGCVTRHLPRALPNATIVSSDIHSEAMDFISGTLGGQVAPSHSVPEEFSVDGKYDVVFSLSFFSHMPKSSWTRWLQAHYEVLEPGGHLVFTTQGLISRPHFNDPEIPEDGFWFIPDSEQKDLDTAEYGQTIVTEEWVRQQIASLPHAAVERFSEGAWWGHQDLYVVQKTAV